jgi:hypothetical protein
MTKFAFIGAAAVLCSALTVPAMAQHRVIHADAYIQNGVCPGHEAGNPYTKEEDYIAWSGWRSRGGWDDRNDFNCLPYSRLHHPAANFGW